VPRDRAEVAAPRRAGPIRPLELAPGLLSAGPTGRDGDRPRQMLSAEDLAVLRELAGRLPAAGAGSPAERRMLEAVTELVSLGRWVQAAVCSVVRG
jgi:hypothetical protein